MSGEANREHAARMKALQAKRRALMKTKSEEGGLLIVHTGDGKASRPRPSAWRCAAWVGACKSASST